MSNGHSMALGERSLPPERPMRALVPDAEKRLLEDLKWAGLQWDEGPQVGGPFGPYKQSERNQIYRKHGDDLLSSGAAYRCFCTPQQGGQAQTAYVTSGCYQNCASLPTEQSLGRAVDKHDPHTVRLKRPEDAKKREYRDLVYGKIVPLKRSPAAVPSDDTDAGVDAADTILMKSDGTPTYHFANVVDDHLMKITHVIRGVEWMASTPLHYDLYHAFGWTPPQFAHVGLLVDEKKAKLSKRNSNLALDVRSMREELGILPDTLVSFLALLGWSNPIKNDIYTLESLIDSFDLKFTKGNTMVRTEKLWYLQKQHVSRLCHEVRRTGKKEPLAPVAAEMSWAILARWPSILPSERFATGLDLLYYCVDILLADSKSYENAKQCVERNRYFFDFDLSSVPQTPEQYYCKALEQDVVVDGASVSPVVESLMHFDYQRPYHVPGYLQQHLAAGSAIKADQQPRVWFEDISARIHAAIEHHALKALVNEASSGPKPWSTKPLDVNDEDIPSTEWPLSNEATLRFFEAVSIPSTLTGEEERIVLRRKKGWQTAVMRYLREKLSYGLPGPSVGAVMALLGYKECCKRLGIEAKASKGW